MTTEAIKNRLKRAGIVSQGMFDRSPIPSAIISMDGVIEYANDALIKVIGDDRLEGKHFRDITHPDFLDKDLDLFSQLVAGSIDSYSLEKKYITVSGVDFPAILTVWVVSMEANTFIFGQFKPLPVI